MKTEKRCFLSLMEIELLDLEKDIELLIQRCRKRCEAANMREYVAEHNAATFRNEILAIKALRKHLTEVNHEDYEQLDDMVNEVEEFFKTTVLRHGFAEAVIPFIERKIQKVRAYIDSSSR